ncbi:hypothetical protein B0H13DRAFT_1895254 [Mycena leptocephala]|nr:hypothetical protein B0H13DRAFT_1895254 [Mycena leptocephala]
MPVRSGGSAKFSSFKFSVPHLEGRSIDARRQRREGGGVAMSSEQSKKRYCMGMSIAARRAKRTVASALQTVACAGSNVAHPRNSSGVPQKTPRAVVEHSLGVTEGPPQEVFLAKFVAPGCSRYSSGVILGTAKEVFRHSCGVVQALVSMARPALRLLPSAQ